MLHLCSRFDHFLTHERAHVPSELLGQDPLSRRRVWDMISKLKEQTVLLLTTHRYCPCRRALLPVMRPE